MYSPVTQIKDTLQFTVISYMLIYAVKASDFCHFSINLYSNNYASYLHAFVEIARMCKKLHVAKFCMVIRLGVVSNKTTGCNHNSLAGVA